MYTLDEYFNYEERLMTRYPQEEPELCTYCGEGIEGKGELMLCEHCISNEVENNGLTREQAIAELTKPIKIH